MKKTLAVIALAGSIAVMGAVPAVAAYPAPVPRATVSDGAPSRGETFTFSGLGFQAGETVTITLTQGRGNGPARQTYTVIANANGEFTLSLDIASPGGYTLTATGAASGKTASSFVNVSGAAAGTALANTGGAALANTGGAALANTGASPDLMLWSLVGAGALAAGATSVIVVRRRAKSGTATS